MYPAPKNYVRSPRDSRQIKILKIKKDRLTNAERQIKLVRNMLRNRRERGQLVTKNGAVFLNGVMENLSFALLESSVIEMLRRQKKESKKRLVPWDIVRAIERDDELNTLWTKEGSPKLQFTPAKEPCGVQLPRHRPTPLSPLAIGWYADTETDQNEIDTIEEDEDDEDVEGMELDDTVNVQPEPAENHPSLSAARKFVACYSVEGNNEPQPDHHVNGDKELIPAEPNDPQDDLDGENVDAFNATNVLLNSSGCSDVINEMTAYRLRSIEQRDKIAELLAKLVSVKEKELELKLAKVEAEQRKDEPIIHIH